MDFGVRDCAIIIGIGVLRSIGGSKGKLKGWVGGLEGKCL